MGKDQGDKTVGVFLWTLGTLFGATCIVFSLASLKYLLTSPQPPQIDIHDVRVDASTHTEVKTDCGWLSWSCGDKQ